MTLATDLVDQLNEWAHACHSAMNGSSFARRWSLDSKSTMRKRVRWSMLNPCWSMLNPCST
jgi:hypothetical protein